MSRQEWALESSIRAIPAKTIAGLAAKARITAHEFDVEHLDEASIATALDAVEHSVDRATPALVKDVLRLARASA